MRFRVLGPVGVEHGGTVVTIGGQRQRALLAVLLAHAGVTFSAARLADAVWDGHPPSSDAALRVQMARLRSTLRRAGADAALSTEPGGSRCAGGSTATVPRRWPSTAS